jgi:peptidoglycan/xylan/chitin deacetylase (PgdA/CDA1 family)
MSAVSTKTFNIIEGWNELVWNGYEHTEENITQLAIEQSNGSAVAPVNTFYIDDIVIKASRVSGSGPDPITREAILAEVESKWVSMGYSEKPTKYMALTYDDGPSAYSQQLLDALAAKDAKATFFLIGNRVNQRPEVVRAMRDAGHELANHSYSHESMGSMSTSDAEQEIQDCSDAIYNATNGGGSPVYPKFFRAPNLNYSSNLYAACANNDFPLIGGQSTGDYYSGPNAGSAQSIANAQINYVKEWQIALCHDPNSGTPANILDAVPLMIDGLRAKGYYLLTLSELLVMRNSGASPEPGSVYVDFVLSDPNYIDTPENLQAAAGDTTIDLSWDTVSGATKYQVQYGIDETFNLTSGDLNTTNWYITGLTNGQTYKLKVRAGNASAWSDYSEPVTANPAAAQTAPEAPAISGVNNDTAGQLTVTWASVSGASKYRYAYDTADDEPSTGTETPALTATIPGLADDTLYYVWVAAGNSVGWSSWTKTSATTKTPPMYVELKRLDFDNLTAFRMTDVSPPSGGARYDWQGGGGTAAANIALSTDQDHTSGSGKSVKFSSRAEKYYRIKFEKIFSPADVGRTFNISTWVYTDAATTVQLGAFRITGGSLDGGTPVDTKTFDTEIGWNKLVWDDYVHTDSDVTQLAIEQPNSATALAGTLYIDDIVVEATEINETEVKNIVFDDLFVFEMTTNPPGEGGIKDWQAGGGTGASNVALSTEQDHTTGTGKSLKFFNRTDRSFRIKFDDIFKPEDIDTTFNASMWVYTETATWIQLSVFVLNTGTVIQRQLFRVEPNCWNELVWRGYVHTDTEGTQLGIEQQGAENVVGTLYIDDLLVTKVDD